LAQLAPGKIFVAIVHHVVPEDRLIDTMRDVVEFQLAYWHSSDKGLIKSQWLPGDQWATAVRELIYDGVPPEKWIPAE
jgi:hypothetical protein